MSYPNHDQFADEVDRRLAKLEGEIDEGIARVINAFNFNARLILGGTAGVPGVPLAAYAIAKGDLDEDIARLRTAYGQAGTDIREIVRRMDAEQLEIDEAMADVYLDAADRLDDEDGVIRAIDRELAAHWEGLAFDAYLRTSDQQRDATDGVATGLREAAVACQDTAASVRQAWSDVVSAINTARAHVGEQIDAGIETSGWVSFDPDPAIGILSSMTLTGSENERTMAQELTATRTNSWARLNQGLDGLREANEWPRPPPGDRVAIDDERNWRQRSP